MISYQSLQGYGFENGDLRGLFSGSASALGRSRVSLAPDMGNKSKSYQLLVSHIWIFTAENWKGTDCDTLLMNLSFIFC